MNIKHTARMKRMKVSHIMRVYKVTAEEAKALRGGDDIKDKPKPVAIKATEPKPLRKESK